MPALLTIGYTPAPPHVTKLANFGQSQMRENCKSQKSTRGAAGRFAGKEKVDDWKRLVERFSKLYGKTGRLIHFFS